MTRLTSPQYWFTATVGRRGLRRGLLGHQVETVVLEAVRIDALDGVMRDHVWLDAGRWCQGLNPGDFIQFKADLAEYGTTDPETGLRESKVKPGNPRRVTRLSCGPGNVASSS